MPGMDESEVSSAVLILRAALALEQAGWTPVSTEALIVAAWQANPRKFGMKGYAELYPDSNGVVAALSGGRGLVGRGWLSKVGPKLYQLTAAGRKAAGEVAPEAPQVNAVRLPAPTAKLLSALLNQKAVAMFRGVRKQELTFANACYFWGIRETMPGEQIEGHLHALETELRAVHKALDGARAVLPDGREVGAGDADLLLDLHLYLRERFARHLALLGSRRPRERTGA